MITKKAPPPHNTELRRLRRGACSSCEGTFSYHSVDITINHDAFVQPYSTLKTGCPWCGSKAPIHEAPSA